MKALLFFLACNATLSLADDAAKKNPPPPPPPSAAAEIDNEVVARRTCKKDKDERVMEIIPTQKGCVLQYTKAGKTEEKAKSVRAVQVCQDAMKKITDRLESAGYHCE